MRLADEIISINQYIVQSEMCNNWGYEKLHKAIDRQAIDEVRHVRWLIQRIIFLEGTPALARLDEVKIGRTVLDMVKNNQETKLMGLLTYNAAVSLAHEIKDEGSVNMLTKIIKMEESHLDWGEKQITQINQMGLKNYLANQTNGVIN
jgi:bacterioferritin